MFDLASWFLSALDRKRDRAEARKAKFRALRTDPVQYFSGNELKIGAEPQRGGGSGHALLLYIAAIIPASFVFVALTEGKPMGEAQLIAGYIALFLYIGFVAGWLIPRFLPRRTITLRAEGITVRDKRLEVVCPWGLFRAAGNIQADADRILIPIAEEAVRFVKTYSRGRPIADGWEVETSFFRFGVGPVVVIPNRFRLDGFDLANFLQSTAWQLCPKYSEEGNQSTQD
jgi:hypothetical protein